MAKYKIAVSEPAENDLRDIVRYISSQLSAPITALKMMDTIEEAIAGLSDIPKTYPLLSDDRLQTMGYHKLLVKNYIVFFSVDDNSNTVNVERILYARRDWLHIL
ncbi:MAG: type II toxin-antitoxin system RelE/ParE family toxin [Peptococcaceae bacterium]|jgi:plasmid stabilization system protein ParE|nr:type II toxin-antitoxin system RelE/ParE family toxin [Peptococcaceae bacterium]